MGIEEFLKMVVSGWFIMVVGGTFVWATWGTIEWVYRLFRPKKRQFFVSYRFWFDDKVGYGSTIIHSNSRDIGTILEEARELLASDNSVSQEKLSIISMNEVQ